MSIQEPRLANIDQAGFLELTAQEPYPQSSFFVYVALAILNPPRGIVGLAMGCGPIKRASSQNTDTFRE